MNASLKPLADEAQAAFELVKEEVQAHPILEGFVLGAAVTAAIACRGKLTSLFPRAEALLGETTSLGEKASFKETAPLAIHGANATAEGVSVVAQVSPESLELQEMYKLDQAVRMPPIDFEKMKAVDTVHQKRLAELLHNGKTFSGDDYYHAAMIMQHGISPEDTALAHVLAMNGAFKGNLQAKWLSAASFDRLLWRLQQPQMFGTQFIKAQGPWTMEPMKLELIPDFVRKDFGVPTAIENEKRMLKMDEEITGPKK